MTGALNFELEHNKTRLAYYTQLKAQNSPKAANNWIEIYAERIQKLERQIKKLQTQQENPGLRTQVAAKKSSSARRA